MDKFKLVSPYKPMGDQPEAIRTLTESFENGCRAQTLLGVTGSGKTFTMANIIANLNRPTLVLSHNKTLAAQLCSEFREFFPENAVEYFVSYYDYYQPEAYIPGRDLYIEKDSAVNDEIDRLRHSATSSLFERRDVIIVASVSCIYSLGDPNEYNSMLLPVRVGSIAPRDAIIERLVSMGYERNDISLQRGKFRARGDTLDIMPASSGTKSVRIEFFDDEIDRITEINSLTGELLRTLSYYCFFPTSHYATTEERRKAALLEIEEEMKERVEYFRSENKYIEAQRIEERTKYDLEMLREIGFCSGVENYSRVMSGRAPGSTPYTLLDYFPKDFITLILVTDSFIPVLSPSRLSCIFVYLGDAVLIIRKVKSARIGTMAIMTRASFGLSINDMISAPTIMMGLLKHPLRSDWVKVCTCVISFVSLVMSEPVENLSISEKEKVWIL